MLFLLACASKLDDPEIPSESTVRTVTVEPCVPEVIIAHNGPAAQKLRCGSRDQTLLALTVASQCGTLVNGMGFDIGTSVADAAKLVGDLKLIGNDGAVLMGPTEIGADKTVLFNDFLRIAAGTAVELRLTADIRCGAPVPKTVSATWRREHFLADGQIIPSTDILGYEHTIASH